MGCKQSKLAGRIQPVGPASVKTDNSKRNGREFDIDHKSGKKIRKSKSQNSKQFGSSVSLDDDRSIADSDRGFSATSKLSKKSGDSGLEADYAFVITEDSDPDKVQQIEQEFCQNENLELTLNGTQCPVRTSAKDRERMEEAMILQSLREEGLITKQQKVSTNYATFEIVAADTTGDIRPPPRLEKLERRRKKKKILTEEEIKEKLERAERRKRKKEEERLNKIKDLEKSNTNNCLELFMVSQKQKEETVNKKLDTAAENKEKKLRELREKQLERERRAERVRQRKQLALLEKQGLMEEDSNIPRGNELEF
ncbi:unnamed protein product [Mytilus coruscus]|uniref:Uncharacterized protein n=1 Tax=Mytilus coruscus TaxID=42192 RepID=A0A6J8DTB1_MYTCO|nr:unnamed protein product [Mytilus coruscus]